MLQEHAVPRLRVDQSEQGVTILVPELPGTLEEPQNEVLSLLVRDYLHEQNVIDPVLWYYTPMAIEFTSTLPSSLIVYDCMDELSAFRAAPPGLRAAEEQLLTRADLVFTGGRSLYQSKQKLHSSVHLFPSSIDVEHFRKARLPQSEPLDQASLARPRLGYCGVIDERMDLDLIAEVARIRPGWQLVMIGPVVKVSSGDLPQFSNIAYLGMKDYKELPAYLAGWDIAMLPFARNESTRFISPTKTPEYLAAGLPTVSTPIRDVVSPYGEAGLVSIAEDAAGFVRAIEQLLNRSEPAVRDWLARADQFLLASSWDRTWSAMWELIQNTRRQRTELAASAD